MQRTTKITIIGSGVVGCTVAYELASHGYRNVAVVEKNSTIPGLNQSSRNGGVIHTGIYYPQEVEPLKANLCVEGSARLYEFCRRYKIPHKKTGKLVLAFNEREEELLNFFFIVGKQNGVNGLRIVMQSEVKRMEPNSGNVRRALFVPGTGIASIDSLVEKLKTLG